MRRRALFALVALVAALAAPGPAPASAGTPANPIVRENRHPGTDRWNIPWPGYKITDDRKLNVKGYATSVSVHHGGRIGLRVTTRLHEPYTVDVYRLGYYQGLGGRHIADLGTFDGGPQPACTTIRSTGTVTCPWHTSVWLDVPQSWVSGVYLAVLTTASRYQSEIPFTVQDNRPADIVYVSPVNTYQAYNNFPYDPPKKYTWDDGAHPLTGRSLYDYNSPVSHRYPDGKPAVKVSFDRPYSSEYGNPGNGGQTDFEPFTISFLEKRGYDVTYSTDVDVDAHPSWLLRHSIVLVSGHSEYWSMRAYDAAYAARDHGVNLAFIASNEILWQIRYEPNAQGVSRRIVVGYKHFKRDPVNNPARQTIYWRDLGRPEQQLVGVQYPLNGYMDWGGQALVPIHTNAWPFAGTGLQDGVPVRGELVGYEIDSFDPRYPAPDANWQLLLARSPFINFNGRQYIHNSSIYEARSGALVFATGSMDWAWALAPGGSSDGTRNNVRRSLQQVTVNVLNRMLASPNRTS